jgi:hypothetical protein
MKLLKYSIPLLLVLITTSCVQKTQPKTILVKVDMNAHKRPQNVGIRGNNPLSWNETTYLQDFDNDGIYEETFNIYTANNFIEFKFVINDSVYELEGQNNRSLSFEYKPENIIYEAEFNELKAKITKN